jgi:hypothetical protein
MSIIRNLFHVFIVFIALSTFALAQSDACKAAEVPVGVVNPNGETYIGLNASSFSGHAGKIAVPVNSMSYDDGPRRILLVVDQGKKVNADSRKAEQDMLAVLLGAARQQDSLALITARGPSHVVKFGEERSALAAAINDEGIGLHGNEIGVMDAMLQGVAMFGESKPGDAMIVMAYDLEGNHGANAKKVAKALEDHHVRMFGLALGPVSTRNITTSGQSTTAWGLATASPSVGEITYDTGDDNFFPLARNSGGLVMAVLNYDSRKNFSMKDPALQARVKQQARTMFNMVSTYYRMQIDPPRLGHSEEWNIEVADSVKKSVPHMFLLYPHQIGTCQTPVSATAK